MSEMMAEVKINEVDVTKIAPGLKTIIKADAYSDTTYTGQVTRVANLAQKKDYNSKIKIFPAEILITGKPEKLLPGLTVSCRILVREIPVVLYIPVEAVNKSQGIEYVYVRKGAGFSRQEVRVGAVNTDYAVIVEGVAENDELALADPFLNKQEESSGSKKQ